MIQKFNRPYSDTCWWSDVSSHVSNLSLLQVIPAERRPPEKEETWTLASDQQDPCGFFDDIVESKAPKAGPQDPEKTQSKPPAAEVITADNAGDNADNNLPRSQETRKSKTKKVKSYLRKCKGALSKGDENVTEKRRQENCTSWYLEDVPPCASNREDRDESTERYTEFPEERLDRDVEPVEDPAPETLEASLSKGENLDKTPDEALARLLEEDRRTDLNRSRTSLYEDAKDSGPEQCAPDEKTPIKEPERFRDDEKKNDAVSLETLTTEDTNLNKCDSSDTLIAETTETAIDPVAEEADKPEASVDDDEEATLPIPAFCGVSSFTSIDMF